MVLHDTFKLYEIQISVSINKLLLEYNHMYSQTCCLCFAFLLQQQSWVVAAETV